MSDLISRESVRAGRIPYDEDLTEYQRGWNDACDAIADNASPAEPERKRGFWWAIEKGEKGYSAGNFRCSVCGEPNVSYIAKPNFCPNCGADMRGELE